MVPRRSISMLLDAKVALPLLQALAGLHRIAQRWLGWQLQTRRSTLLSRRSLRCRLSCLLSTHRWLRRLRRSRRAQQTHRSQEISKKRVAAPSHDVPRKLSGARYFFPADDAFVSGGSILMMSDAIGGWNTGMS